MKTEYENVRFEKNKENWLIIDISGQQIYGHLSFVQGADEWYYTATARSNFQDLRDITAFLEQLNKAIL